MAQSALFLSEQSPSCLSSSEPFLKSSKKMTMSCSMSLQLLSLCSLSIENSLRKYLTWMSLLSPRFCGLKANFIPFWVRQLASESTSNSNCSSTSSPKSSNHFYSFRGTYSQKRCASPCSVVCMWCSPMTNSVSRVVRNPAIFCSMASSPSDPQESDFRTSTWLSSPTFSWIYPKGQWEAVISTMWQLLSFCIGEWVLLQYY